MRACESCNRRRIGPVGCLINGCYMRLLRKLASQKLNELKYTKQPVIWRSGIQGCGVLWSCFARGNGHWHFNLRLEGVMSDNAQDRNVWECSLGIPRR